MTNVLISNKYQGLPVKRITVLYGVEMPSLEDFTAIMKMDEELTLEAFLKMFKNDPDGYDIEIVEKAFKVVPALKPEEIFTEKFSNVEVRAAILKYASPEKVFKALLGKVIDKWKTYKEYPKLEIIGIEGKPDSHRIEPQNIKRSVTKRKEEYELIEIKDERLINFLPWGETKIVLLKMTCPSSCKIYYEYIDPKIFDERNKTAKALDKFKSGHKVKLALCWQMEKHDRDHLTFGEYQKIFSET